LSRLKLSIQALADFPAAIFAEELIKAYPSAKIILSVRDEDVWFKSMMATLWHAYANPPEQPTAMRPLAEKYHEYMWGNDFPQKGREAYRKHNDAVRSIEKGGRDLLEYDVKDGWGPLCEFLGVEVPEKGLPREDDWIKYKATHGN
jgi:hypothetical protein